MIGSRAAKRYAKAVLSLAQDKGALDAVFADMQSVATTISSSKDLQVVLENPAIKIADKHKALLAIFSNTNDITKNLFKLLTANKRLALLQDVAVSFNGLYNESKGVQEAKVTTAIAITDTLKDKVLAKVKELTGRSAVLENVVDPAIIGGFILRVGDLQYDASIANKFRKLKRELSN